MKIGNVILRNNFDSLILFFALYTQKTPKISKPAMRSICKVLPFIQNKKRTGRPIKNNRKIWHTFPEATER